MKCAGGRSPPRSSKCVINFLLLSYWCRPRSPELFCFHSISPDDRHVIREYQLFARLNDFLGGFRNIRTLTVIQPATYHRMSTLLNKGLKTAYTICVAHRIRTCPFLSLLLFCLARDKDAVWRWHAGHALF